MAKEEHHNRPVRPAAAAKEDTHQEPADKTQHPKVSKEEASKEENGTNVTYVPREGDPVSTHWHGHTFRAGKPTRVAHPELLEKAKANPWFEVEGHDPAKQPAPDAMPTDPESYRRHAIAKINAATSSAALDSWWMSEAPLRQSLGVGSQDEEYLSKLLVPRMAELKKAEA